MTDNTCDQFHLMHTRDKNDAEHKAKNKRRRMKANGDNGEFAVWVVWCAPRSHWAVKLGRRT